MYLVSLYYKGALNVDMMRLVKTQREVLERLAELGVITKTGYGDQPNEVEMRNFRVYNLAKNIPPVNLTHEFYEKYLACKENLGTKRIRIGKRLVMFPSKLSKSSEFDPTISLSETRVGEIVFPDRAYFGSSLPFLCKRINHPLEEMCGIPRFRVIASYKSGKYERIGKVIWFPKSNPSTRFVRFDEKKHDTTGMEFLEGWKR